MAQHTAHGTSHGGPDRRRRELAAYVLSAGPVPAAELAARFGVSLMTVYRDIEELEREGVLRKTRGGVTARPSGVFEPNVAYRKKAMRAEKAALAAHALRLVEPGMSVMLDDSTTVLELARLLPAVEPLTVATNFLEALNLLTGERGLRLLGLGGEYDPLHDSFLGVGCEEAVGALRVDVCFVSTSSVAGGFAYHQEQRIVAVKRAMIAAAGRCVLLIDHSKLARGALHRLAPLSAFDLVVVDGRAPGEALRALEESGVPYEVAPVPEAGAGAGPDTPVGPNEPNEPNGPDAADGPDGLDGADGPHRSGGPESGGLERPGRPESGGPPRAGDAGRPTASVPSERPSAPAPLSVPPLKESLSDEDPCRR
ncbi:DeoR/GlpR family DNA-binding transcription regulator [Streptomyces sp. 8L]|uniref:DeoR/GlpR family DNA-binding transcription regulator n=1 Tax=Streptomyces sp. 8L TaxID=2877242 RepID=UPI001CD1C96F|nr:DeoR/GlpR family DNA-binding transcription regulator [Streptomyces sp. 8L]MCA1218531.1 DeoR family transcriptional regulator [Streptomyces sp. 8L]